MSTAFYAENTFRVHGVSPHTFVDNSAAIRAFSRFKLRWVGQDFEIVFIGAEMDIGFQVVAEIFFALRAGHPVAIVTFLMMETAKSILVMISVTAIAGVREQGILIFIVADPFTATFGACEIAGRPAQPANRHIGPLLSLFLRR